MYNCLTGYQIFNEKKIQKKIKKQVQNAENACSVSKIAEFDVEIIIVPYSDLLEFCLLFDTSQPFLDYHER